VPEAGHPLANGGCVGWAERSGVFFGGGRIEAQILWDGAILRTRDLPASESRCGLAQVRRVLSEGSLRVAHVVFAPEATRPLLLGIARVQNAADEPIVLDYTEMWEVGTGSYRVGPGGAERDAPGGTRALVDVGYVVRARPPEKPPAEGLALDVTLAVPPRATRTLEFAYALPAPDEAPASIVRAWRGDVTREIARTVQVWAQRLTRTGDPVAAYRQQVVDRA